MRESAKPFYVVFAIAAALVVPAAIALRTVIHPVILQATSDNPTPLGYTWSLLLFVVPIGGLGWWFACRPDLVFFCNDTATTDTYTLSLHGLSGGHPAR